MVTKLWTRSLALAAATVVVGLSTAQVMAANSVSGHAQAAIVQAINLTENANLDFGFVIPSGSDGTLVVPASASPVPVPTNVTYLNGATAGAWTVTGTPNQPMVIQLDTTDTLNSGTNSMTVDGFNHDVTTLNFGTTGSVSFHVGATLHVLANQPAGSYIGNYQVTVNY